MLPEEILPIISAFKSPIIDLLKDIKDETAYFFDNGLFDYLNSQRIKYLFAKTFLFRNEKVNFLEIYYPISIKSKNKITYKVLLEKNFDEIFYNSKYATIIGNAGSGKSMLFKYIFLRSLDLKFKMPIYIELRNFNHFEGNIIDYIYQIIFDNKLTPNKKILERILEKGVFLFLIDGYDEIKSDKLFKCTSDLESFIDKYPSNHYIISSRPGANIETFPRFDNFHVQPLKIDEIKDYIRMQLKQTEDDQLASKIIDAIKNGNDYEAYLSSPLLLSMFILVFSLHPTLPNLKSKFYWNVFDTLCTRHDSVTKRGGYQHERRTGLQNDDLENILKWFSYISFFESRYNFDLEYLHDKLRIIKEKFKYTYEINDMIEDLTISVPIILQDGNEYKFIHRTMQEYFAVLLISQQSDKFKEKIYSGKVREIFYSWGLTTLFLELDKVSYYRFFLINVLNEYLHAFESTNEKETIFKFLKKQNINLFLAVDGEELRSNGYTSGNNSNDDFDFYCIAITNLYFHSQFIMHRVDLMLVKIKNTKPQFLLDLIKKEIITSKESTRSYPTYDLDFSKHWNDEVYEFVKYIGLDKSILFYLSKVKDELREMQQFVIDEEKNKEFLLTI